MVSRADWRSVSRAGLRLGAALILLLAAVSLISGAGSIVGANAGSIALTVRAVGDLDGDGETEEYILTDNVLTVTEGAKVLWKSSADWHVDSFVLGDVDNDGRDNLVISLWKKGSFGAIRPFWQTSEDAGYKNHLFVYKLQENTCKAVWCSSDLDRPILSFTIRDFDGDGLNELVVEEGQYRKVAGERYAPDPDGSVRTAVWQWEEWGFRLCDSAPD